MKRIPIIYLFLLGILCSFAIKSDKPAYKLYNSKGAETKYSKLLKAAASADIVLFGELHDNPICHWLELELATELAKGKKPLVMGAEMFEADNQKVVDSFLAGEMDEKQFKAAELRGSVCSRDGGPR